MAGVPSYDNFRVTPRGQAGFSLAVPGTEGFDEPARQVARASQVASDAGNVLGDIGLQAAHEANTTRVMDAENQAREAALKLAYDPHEGYTNVKGGDVLPRDGKPLAVDYTGKFDEQLKAIGGGLVNDAQRAMFNEKAAQLRGTFEAGALEHESREWSGYQLSVADGARQLAIEGIAKAHSNPAAVDTELAGLDTAVYQLGKLKGLSGDEITAMQDDNRSAALKQSIAAAIGENDLTTAQGLFGRYGDKLNEADMIAVKGVLEKETIGRDVMASADIADGLAPVPEGGSGVNASSNAVWPNIVHTEGGTNRDGSFRTSPKGAVGPAQLMPGTAPEAMRLAGFSADDQRWKTDPKINEAAGRAYYNNLLKRYRGNAAYAVAAYNAGAGRVNQAIAAGGADWQQHLPPETRKYVHSVLGGSTGSSTPTVRPPTLDEMYATARDHFLKLHPDAQPEAIRDLRQEVEARWTMHEKSRAATDEGALQNAYVGLVQNGGSYQALPASVRASIPADKLPSVFEFARNIQHGNDRAESDAGTYLHLSDPKTLAAMSDSDFMGLKGKLTDSDWQQFSKDRANAKLAIQKGATAAAKDAQSLPRDAINNVVNQRLVAAGLPTSPKADDNEAPHVAAVRMFVDRAILGEQAKLGRQLTEGEAHQFVDELFIRNHVTVSSWLGPSKEVSAFSIGSGQISSSDRKNIVDWFQQHGVDNPSEADILTRLYSIRWRQSGAR